MQAIVTKYIAATNHKGSRVKAKCQAGSVTVSWDDALNIDDNHEAAAKALLKKLGWSWAVLSEAGGMPDGKGNVYLIQSPTS